MFKQPTIMLIVLIIALTGCNGAPTADLATPAKTPIPTDSPALITPTTELPDSSSTLPEGAVVMTDLCSADNAAIRAFQASAPDIADYTDEQALAAASDEFDPNGYFSILTHLQVEPGFYLDHLYYVDETGGKPMLYAMENNKGPYDQYVDFLSTYGDWESKWERSFLSPSHSLVFLDHILIDSTPESYFQFFELGGLAGQYQLAGNARHDDTTILCSDADVAWLEEEMAAWGLEIPEEVRAQLETIDLTPYVEIEYSRVVVRLVQFSKWAGIAETLYFFTPEEKGGSPMLLGSQWNIIYEYDSGLAP